MVKCRHEEVEVGRQRLHHGDLGLGSTHNGGYEFGSPGIGIQPGRKRGSIQRLEVTLDTLRGPGV